MAEFGFTIPFDEIGDTLGQNFTQSELEMLADLLREAVRACHYAAEDYAYRSSFDDSHGGGETDDFAGLAEDYTAVAADLTKLVAAIDAGEQRYREED